MNHKLNQYGSGYFQTLHGSKDYEKTVWFMAQLDPSSYTARILQQNKDILLNNISDGRSLHLTLLTMHFNLRADKEVLDIILPVISGQRRLHRRITDIVNAAYDQTFRLNKPVLRQIPAMYYMMGPFMAKLFVMRDREQEIITHFRMMIYKEIEKLFAERGYTIVKPIDTTTNPEYAIVSVVKGASLPIPIYAIPEYDYGRGNWTPHISVGNILDIKTKNLALYQKFEQKVIDRATNPGDFAGTKIEKFKLDTLRGKLPVYRWAGVDFFHIAKLNDVEDMNINMATDITHVVVDCN